LLLTNDTQLAARLTDPDAHIPKVYEVELDAPIGAAEVRRLSEGVPIAGRMTRRAIVELMRGQEASHVRVTLVEGRNRQVRRMFQSIDRTVVALRRVAIGPLHIRGLAEGQVRPLRPREIESLLAIKTAARSRG
jgi:23S rRNA pseudouridine2605 synthase